MATFGTDPVSVSLSEFSKHKAHLADEDRGFFD